jgi:hypothetical protein
VSDAIQKITLSAALVIQVHSFRIASNSGALLETDNLKAENSKHKPQQYGDILHQDNLFLFSFLLQ